MFSDTKEKPAGISKFCRAFRPKLLEHDDNLKKDPTEFRTKTNAKCAPDNYYKAQNWNQLLARTLSANDICKPS